MGLVVNVSRICPAVDVSFSLRKAHVPVTIRRVAPPISVFWRKTAEEVVDLVPFSVVEGMYLTREGYTILVRNN